MDGVDGAHVRPVIVDTDCGIDDALALDLMLCSSTISVRAVTVVFGNVPLPAAALAAQLVISHRVADVSKRPPVYQGCNKALLGHAPLGSWPGHGDDGLGGAAELLRGLLSDRDAPTQQPSPCQTQHASVAICELARNSSVDTPLTLLALGPLTNIAVALQLDPTLPSHCRQLVLMGGCSQGRGNASFCAEFNFLSDPEAAKIVLDAFAGRAVIVPWETTLAAPIAWSVYDAMPAQSLIRLVCDKYAQMERDPNRAAPGALVLCDLIAALLVVHPKAIVRGRRMRCAVQTGEGPGRGALFFDWSRETPAADGALLVEEVNSELLERVALDVWGAK